MENINLDSREEGEPETPEIPDVPLSPNPDTAVPFHQGSPSGPAEHGTPEAAHLARRASPEQRIPPTPAQYPPGNQGAQTPPDIKGLESPPPICHLKVTTRAKQRDRDK